jgi:hypothetical protein
MDTVSQAPPSEFARRLAPALALAAAFLLPWALWLTKTLPSSHVSRHWDLAWGGFDLGLALALALTATAALRSSPWLSAAASATGTLLLVDGWFDVLTAREGSELAVSASGAVLVELPLAALSFWIARDAARNWERLCGCLDHPGRVLRRPRP